jgi:hypothetical protein
MREGGRKYKNEIQQKLIASWKKRLINPGTPAAHPEPAYRCFLPDLTGFTGPRLRRTRAHERLTTVQSSPFDVQSKDPFFIIYFEV